MNVDEFVFARKNEKKENKKVETKKNPNNTIYRPVSAPNKNRTSTS